MANKMATMQGCCCGCCSEPGGKPTSSFDWEESTDVPCCIDFTDTSVAGHCGEIVSVEVDFGDGETSTDFNPSHCYDEDDEGPWEVTWTVTDSAGCKHTSKQTVSCCDCEADGPVADLSYMQTNDSPCTIDLFDESVAGSCGEIVAWRWLKNGVEFSTAQNPTGVTVSDGDDITLEVTDSKDCDDSAVMEIECETMHNCTTCNSDTKLPDSVSITVAGVTNGSCTTCGQLNGTFTRNWYNEVSNGAPDGTRACIYGHPSLDGIVGSTACLGGSGSRKFIEVGFTSSYMFAYLHSDVFGAGAVYRLARSGTCRGSYTLSLYSCSDTTIGGGTPPNCNNAGARCNWPATVTVTI